MNERKYRFGEFEVDSVLGELRRGESSVRLQQKPLQLLLLLLENSQKVVTRELLRDQLWGSGTYVDYEQGINVAIKKLREALSDSAENPRFIQTVAKKGYRFLLPVQTEEEPSATPFEPIPPSPPSKRTRTESATHLWRSHTFWVAALLVLAVAFPAIWISRRQSQRHHPAQIRSLAVLPLRNLSPDPGQEYLADGITEELITNLAQTLPLRVISHTSVMRYKETSESMAQIARELGADAIVEGAVTRLGDQVTVTVQLIDASEDRHLWAQQYQRNVGDLLEMQANLSQEISSHIGGTLNSQLEIKAAKTRAVNPQVYELCLLGRYQWNKRTAPALLKAIEYFKRAIDLDPNYAPAYAGLASAYVILPHYDHVNLDDYLVKAAAAAHQALALDDTLVEAHSALGFIALNHWVFEAEESGREFRRALQLNPNDAAAHHWFAFYLLFSGHQDEAVREMELARQLDPLSAITNADEGDFLYAAGRNKEARTRLLQAIELAPDFGQPHSTLALIDLEEAQHDQAISEARAALTLDPDNPRTLGESGFVLAATGYREEAKKLLVTLTDQVNGGLTFSTYAALIHVGLGERREAFDLLQQTVRTSGFYPLNQWRSVFALIQDDSRYQELREYSKTRSQLMRVGGRSPNDIRS